MRKIKEICEATSASAAARGTGISGRTQEFLATKMNKGEAVIAFAPDGRWAGFSFISARDNGRYVSNSGLIILLSSAIQALQKGLKDKFSNWSA